MQLLLAAIALDRAQLRLCQSSYTSRYCGYAAIDSVNSRSSEAPMAGRVLVPWLVALAERLVPGLHPYRMTALYEPLKILLIWGALWASSLALDERRALWLAVLLPITFYFDYWDWAVELGGLALAMTGRIEYALIGGLLLALSRETAPLVPATYALVSHDFGRALQVLAAVWAVMLAVRLWNRHPALYCDRWMIRQNLLDLRHIRRNRPVYLSEIGMSLLLTGATLYIVLRFWPPAWIVPVALLAMGWTMARAAETRVFAACLLWVAWAM